MILIVSDLDGTLLPNGKHKDDTSIGFFFEKLKKVDSCLTYASGRNLDQTRSVIQEFSLEVPDYLIAEVGTRVYHNTNGSLLEDASWKDYLMEHSENWDRNTIERIFETDGMELQENWNQNDFKVSFYFHSTEKPRDFLESAQKKLEEKGMNVLLVWSTDPLETVGLVDVLPKFSGKGYAVEFLRKKLGFEKKDVYYAGDSGNDLSALTQGYSSILVNNSHSSIKDAFKKINTERGFTNYYLSQNNYAAGIIEGLSHFGVFD